MTSVAQSALLALRFGGETFSRSGARWFWGPVGGEAQHYLAWIRFELRRVQLGGRCGGRAKRSRFRQHQFISLSAGFWSRGRPWRVRVHTVHEPVRGRRPCNQYYSWLRVKFGLSFQYYTDVAKLRSQDTRGHLKSLTVQIQSDKKCPSNTVGNQPRKTAKTSPTMTDNEVHCISPLSPLPSNYYGVYAMHSICVSVQVHNRPAEEGTTKS
ncbi:hypothetical protein V8C34DRAFT_59412 [Trichoderma compactum]